MRRVNCDYCGKPAQLVKGKKVYGAQPPSRQHLYGMNFWHCPDCEAWVGCHKGGTKDEPMGRLANKQLRGAKMRAHAVFDPLWMSGEMTRSEAYAWLAEALGVSPANCHIGMFDVDGCKAVESACAERAYVKSATRAYPHLEGEAE